MSLVLALGAVGTAVADGMSTDTADALSPSIYFYPSVYYSSLGGGQKAKHDYSFGPQFTLGYFFAPSWGVELLSEIRHVGISGQGGRVDEDGASLQGIYKLKLPADVSTVQPFLSAGAGWVHGHYEQQGASVPLVRGGVGLIWSPFDFPLDVRGDVAYRHEFSNTAVPQGASHNPSDWIYNVGLSYRWNLGETTSSEPTVEQPPSSISTRPVASPASDRMQALPPAQHDSGCTVDQGTNTCVGPPDQDGDGVPDVRDKCPDTPPGAVVDADGCLLYLSPSGNAPGR